MDNQDKATQLSEAELDAAAGGFETAWPAKWKGFSLDGKAETALLEVSGITPDAKTVVGGFSDVSGLGSEVG